MSGELEKLLIRLEADTTQLRRALNQADGAVGNFATGVDRRTAAVERRFQRMQSSVNSALSGLAMGATLRQVGAMADQYTNMENRLKVVAKSSGDLELSQKRLLEIANETRLQVGDVAEMYSRYAFALKDSGKTTNEVLRFTELLNKAVIISGASTAEAAGALRQFSQGLAAGQIRGQELNSVMEQMPVLAGAIADSLGVTIGQLRKMGEEGKITGEVAFDAVMKAGERFDESFKKTSPSISQSFAQMTNSLLELGHASGVFGILTKSMQGWSKVFSEVSALVKRDEGAVATAVGGGLTVPAATGAGMLGAGAGLQGNIRGENKTPGAPDPWNTTIIPPTYEEQLREAKAAWDELREAQMSTLDDLLGDKTETAAAKMAALTAAVKDGSITWRDYSDGVADVKAQTERANDDMLSSTTNFLDTMFQNNKMAATASALINTYQGITKALSAYPPPYSTAMAAMQAAMGFAQVRAINSTNKSSRGGGSAAGAVSSGAAASAAPAAAAAAPQQDRALTVRMSSMGELIGRRGLRELMEQIVDAQRDGYRVVLG